MKVVRLSRRSPRRHEASIFEPLESRQLMAVAAGVPDRTFGPEGRTTLEFQGVNLTARDVAVQSDGKTVVVGSMPILQKRSFVVARFNFDGTPDTSFDPSFHRGFVATKFDKDADANAVAIQPDGKIVVAGHIDFDKWVVVRYLPNGALDNSFDGDGKRTIDYDGSIQDLVLQSDGKIVLAGENSDGGFLGLSPNTNFAVARLNPDGKPDRTFDGEGKTQIGLGSEFEEAKAAAIDSRGRIVLAGDVILSDGNNFAIGLTRVNANGTKDTTFGKQGTVLTSFPGHPTATAESVLIQPSGKIVIAGHTGDHKTNSFALARYLPTGKLDTTFGSAGTGLVELSFSGKDDRALDIIQSVNGALVVAGAANGKFALAGFTADGRRNDFFGVLGKATPAFGSVFPLFGMGIAQGPGRRFTVAGGSHFTTARFLDTGANVVSAVAVNAPADLLAAETAAPAAPRTASFIIDRSERLPVPTRVFLRFAGSAQQAQFKIGGGQLPGDYTLSGLGRGTIANVIGTPFVDIPAGQTSAKITLTPVDDAVMEPVETVLFEVLPNEKYNVNALAPRVLVSIADNDSVHVNFQAPGSVPAGYVADTGLAFGSRGNGLSYGWDADNTLNARRQNNPGSPDERYDTYNHLQKSGADRKWEIALPAGIYTVRIVAGDASNIDSVYKLDLEGLKALAGTPSGDTRWFRSTVNVLVTDGRLTLSNGAGAINNKIAFIDIKAAAPGALPGPVAVNLPVRLLSAATANLWHRLPNGLFADNQIDEPLWN